MYRACSFAAGQLIVDAQAQAYTCKHLLPHSVRFTRPTVWVWITVCRCTLSQHNRRKDGFHFNKRNCFSLELKAEIINAVDLKRKTKAQIYTDCKYNIKIFAWNTLYLLERQRSHETIQRPMIHCSPRRIIVLLLGCSYLSDKNSNFYTSKPTAMPYERAIVWRQPLYSLTLWRRAFPAQCCALWLAAEFQRGRK